MKYNEELLSIEEKAGSFYFFIPQVITCTFPWVAEFLLAWCEIRISCRSHLKLSRKILHEQVM